VSGDKTSSNTTRLRVGAVGYLNARPHVYGLDSSPRFDLRFDVPSKCADLLHEGAIDLGLIPSIEYLRGPAEAPHTYRIVPDVAIASRGPVESVALYARKAMRDVRSIALDTSSRTSVALARVLCAREFRIRPLLYSSGPDLEAMLTKADAALLIGDAALFLDAHTIGVNSGMDRVEKTDLGAVWTRMTGLPFVYAFWAGRPGPVTADDVARLRRARDDGIDHVAEVAAAYSGDPRQQAIGARYLRDNIKYDLGPDERAGLELFYQYAAEAGVVPGPQPLRFYETASGNVRER
jgi:chorismate dehydratase